MLCLVSHEYKGIWCYHFDLRPSGWWHEMPTLICCLKQFIVLSSSENHILASCPNPSVSNIIELLAASPEEYYTLKSALTTSHYASVAYPLRVFSTAWSIVPTMKAASGKSSLAVEDFTEPRTVSRTGTYCPFKLPNFQPQTSAGPGNARFYGRGNQQFVVFAQLVDTENGDNVLQIFVALQNLLHVASGAVMFFADDVGLQRAAGGGQRIHSRRDFRRRRRDPASAPRRDGQRSLPVPGRRSRQRNVNRLHRRNRTGLCRGDPSMRAPISAERVG